MIGERDFAPDAPLSPELSRRVEAALRWLRRRDEVLADCLEEVEVRAGPHVLLAAPARAGWIRANPEALRSLEPEELAGALVACLLVAPDGLTGEELDTRELQRRVESIRRSYGRRRGGQPSASRRSRNDPSARDSSTST